MHTLDVRFPEALDLIGDVVLAPAFGASDVEIERGVILEEIGEANDNPDDLVHETFVESFWRGHPLGAPILGTEETVRAIGRDDIYRYYRSRYVPANLVVVLARARSGGAGARGGRAASRPARRKGPAPPGRAESAASARTTSPSSRARGSSRSTCAWGSKAPPQTSDRRYAAALFDIALGGGMSSRLFQEVREKRGLAYSIGSALNSYGLGGYETVSAACAPKNLPRLIEVTLRELGKLKRGGVSRRELSRAKENLKSNMLLALESTVSRMSSAARQELYLGRVEAPEELIAKVEAVRLEDVDAEAARLLDGRALSLSVVGNLERLPVTRADLAAAL